VAASRSRRPRFIVLSSSPWASLLSGCRRRMVSPSLPGTRSLPAHPRPRARLRQIVDGQCRLQPGRRRHPGRRAAAGRHPDPRPAAGRRPGRRPAAPLAAVLAGQRGPGRPAGPPSADGAGRRRPLCGRRPARGGRARRRRHPAAAVRGVLRPRHRRDPVRQRGRLDRARRGAQGPAGHGQRPPPGRPDGGQRAGRPAPGRAAVRDRRRGAVPAGRRVVRGRGRPGRGHGRPVPGRAAPRAPPRPPCAARSPRGCAGWPGTGCCASWPWPSR
jgi:hypothetical protein